MLFKYEYLIAFIILNNFQFNIFFCFELLGGQNKTFGDVRL